MTEKYNKGDTVVYDTYGLCSVEDIRNISFSKLEQPQDYYVLSPLANSISTYYVPINNEKAASKLRLPLTKEQVDGMLSQVQTENCSWIDNRQLRSDSFQGILRRGISSELISLIHCIYLRKEVLTKQGKHLSATDENIFSSAEKLLNEELSFALGIEKEKVSEYISAYFENKA